MNNRKSQNSILFLTTLGVYLGLVLIGATPQVLAQAATAKQFNVKDEIEVKDDLDNKPDLTAKDFSGVVETYFEDLSVLVNDLKKLNSIDKFDLSFETFHTDYAYYRWCPEDGTVGGTETRSNIDRWLAPAIKDATWAPSHHIWLSDCLSFKDEGFPKRKNAQTAGLTLSYDKKELRYEISVNFKSAERAKSIHDGLIGAFEHFVFDEDDKDFALNKSRYERTKLATANNQVSVVTRLPRGSLDSLLATDAK